MSTTKFFRVIDGPVNIRAQPDTSAVKVSGQLQTGQQVEVVAISRTINDGFIWWQHSLGWSVECKEDSSLVFMQEIVPETDKAKGTAVVNIPDTATITLPTGAKVARTFMFERHPVRLEETAWVQYFGNTRFAFNLCMDRVPTRQRMYFYCQSLHGGLDYGNQKPGPQIVAGIHGIVEKVELGAKSYAPNCVRVKAGDFTIIYGHMGKVVSPPVGQSVTPDTPMGQIEGSQCHLHLEVRYKNTWVINPLLFMSPALSEQFISKYRKDFYSDANWTQWQTPFDQPILKCSTPDKAVIIGPRAARG